MIRRRHVFFTRAFYHARGWAWQNGAAVTSESSDRQTILAVDDDPDILGMITLRLGKRGYEVLTATDGEEALELALSRLPDLVVLDVMMPKASGWEVARALRQDKRTKDIKIVIVTAIGEQVNAMTSPLYQVDAHIDKPFDFTVLEAKIDELLA